MAGGRFPARGSTSRGGGVSAGGAVVSGGCSTGGAGSGGMAALVAAPAKPAGLAISARGCIEGGALPPPSNTMATEAGATDSGRLCLCWAAMIATASSATCSSTERPTGHPGAGEAGSWGRRTAGDAARGVMVAVMAVMVVRRTCDNRSCGGHYAVCARRKRAGTLKKGNPGAHKGQEEESSSTCPWGCPCPPQTWPASVTGGAGDLLPRVAPANYAILCELRPNTEGLLRYPGCAPHNSSAGGRSKAKGVALGTRPERSAPGRLAGGRGFRVGKVPRRLQGRALALLH